MTGPRRPDLHVVGNERRDNPLTRFGDLFVTAAVTALGTVLATLTVTAVFNRKNKSSSGEAPQALPPQQQFYALPPSPFAQPQIPQGGTFMYFPPGSSPHFQGGFGNFGGVAHQPIAMPQALHYAVANPTEATPIQPTAIPRPTQRAPNPQAANDAAPSWFTSWTKDFSKRQDARFASIESLLANDEGEYDDEQDAG